MSEPGLRVLATLCHTSSCCPMIMESSCGEEVVIVGSIAAALLSSASFQERVGAGEAAVVIPKSLLIEAFNELLAGNVKSYLQTIVTPQ